MTHEWVEQEKKRLAEKFENYPQRLLDEWYAIPEEYRDVSLKKYNLWPEKLPTLKHLSEREVL